jgi:hypothetical protein
MLVEDVNLYPFFLLLNYWEYTYQDLLKHCDALVKSGTHRIISFIPWQLAEADPSHTQLLYSFLQMTSERKIHVFLVVTPEVGLHLSNNGLPKDIILSEKNQAQDQKLRPMLVVLPPRAFSLPSFFSPEFIKRYYGFLNRIDQLFFDIKKNQPHLFEKLTIVLTGSFWKYYREPATTASYFDGIAGDFSSQVDESYRQCMDHFFSQKEYSMPTAAAANAWKTRSLEKCNRRWFYQHSEDMQRYRSFQSLQKKSTFSTIKEFELFTPEADPDLKYLNFLKMISPTQITFKRLSDWIEENSSRVSYGGLSATSPFVQWSCMGLFSELHDAEKEFLILKSLLLFGARHGGIILDQSDWSSLSENFRSEFQILASALKNEELQLHDQIIYLSSHLWSPHEAPWKELFHLGFPRICMLSSKDLLFKNKNAHLLVVDPNVIINHELLKKMLSWITAGRVLVLPKNNLYSKNAEKELSLLLKEKNIEITTGIPYQLCSANNGTVILYDVSDTKNHSDWKNFARSILSITEIEKYCHANDSRLSLLCFEEKSSQNTGSSGMNRLIIFILNPTRKEITTDLLFSSNVQMTGIGDSWKNLNTCTSDHAKKFSLKIKPLGFTCTFFEGIDFHKLRENRLANFISQETKNNVLEAAASELPGLESEWNESWI